ncbi:hypothetical protein BH10CHL1_BH10CHL1_40850 [soil metagenome]
MTMLPHSPTLRRAPIRLWPIRAISLLLLIQAISLLGFSLYLFSNIDWESEFNDVALSIAALETASFIGFFVPVAAFMIFAAIGFFFLWRIAWLIAMITQGSTLFGALSIYFTFTSPLSQAKFIYLIMLYSIVLVLYLNTNEIRITFQSKSPLSSVQPDDEAATETADQRIAEKIANNASDY